MLWDRCLSCLPVCLSVTLVYCGQTVGWIKMPLGMQVGLGPGPTVLDGNAGPPRKGAQQPPTFRPACIVAKRSPISETAELLLLYPTNQPTNRQTNQPTNQPINQSKQIYTASQVASELEVLHNDGYMSCSWKLKQYSTFSTCKSSDNFDQFTVIVKR